MFRVASVFLIISLAQMTGSVPLATMSQTQHTQTHTQKRDVDMMGGMDGMGMGMGDPSFAGGGMYDPTTMGGMYDGVGAGGDIGEAGYGGAYDAASTGAGTGGALGASGSVLSSLSHPGIGGALLPLGLENFGLATPGPQIVPIYGTGVGYGKVGLFRNAVGFDTFGLSRLGFRSLGLGGGLGQLGAASANQFNNNPMLKNNAQGGGNPSIVIDVGLLGGVASANGITQAADQEAQLAWNNLYNAQANGIVRMMLADVNALNNR